MVWATRMAGFLLFRVLKTGGDARFDEIRSHFFKFLGFWIGKFFRKFAYPFDDGSKRISSSDSLGMQLN
jgi:hypothetical protein